MRVPLASPSRSTAALNQNFCPELAAALHTGPHCQAVLAAPSCMPPLQLVDTLSLLCRRGPSLPLHSRWTSSSHHPTSFSQLHGQSQAQKVS
ncbi:hypothetical protein WJX84_012455 [Apatococcus fuscideae]|uniref:Uncharacterized protein n=1 Tax=Apatococcus fuscideae TaxID=2026836 RepID=A0AAW1SH69_9CHLO